jgi:CRP/FNR family transcriptional regulator
MNQTIPQNVIKLDDLKVACRNCTLFQLCLPIGVSEADLELLDRIIKRRRPVRRGEYLYRSGDSFQSIFAVKSGAFKTFIFTEDGREQITGLHLPGELFGLEGISSGKYCCAAMALERSAVCEIPFDRLEELGAQVPSLLSQMLRIMSREMGKDKQVLQVTKTSADGKLAGLLLSLSERYRERGFSAQAFRLSMSRSEIGNYLGLAEETVSRLFTLFQDEGLLTVRRKEVNLLDIPGLRAIVLGTRVVRKKPAQA